MEQKLFRAQMVSSGKLLISDSILTQTVNGKRHVWLKSKFWEEVIPETIMDFIGFCDKNGNKIFEDDIVKVTTGLEGYKSTYHSTIHRVTYVCNCGVAVFYPFDNSDMVEVEVIGNIYNNPELLEEI